MSRKRTKVKPRHIPRRVKKTLSLTGRVVVLTLTASSLIFLTVKAQEIQSWYAKEHPKTTTINARPKEDLRGTLWDDTVFRSSNKTLSKENPERGRYILLEYRDKENRPKDEVVDGWYGDTYTYTYSYTLLDNDTVDILDIFTLKNPQDGTYMAQEMSRAITPNGTPIGFMTPYTSPTNEVNYDTD